MQWILLMSVILYQWSSLVSEPMEADKELLEQNNNNGDDWKGQKTSTLAMVTSRNVPGYVADDEDLANNGVVFQFRRSIKSDNTEIEARRRSALDKNFMRFGRADKNMLRFGKADKNMLRFGRAPGESSNFMRLGRSQGVNPDYSRFQRAQRANGHLRFGRDPDAQADYNDAREIDDLMEMPSSRNDKIPSAYDGVKTVRLGRSSESADSESYETPVETVADPSSPVSKKSGDKNIMRFGRPDQNMMRFGRPDQNMMRFGRDPDMTRLQRGDDKNIMRFGRNDKNMMRFGRSDKNIMRFGRNDKNMMRFGRANDKNIMRFGRSDKNIMRFGRSDKNIMRFGRNDKNVLRFGKRDSEPLPNIYCVDDNCYHMEEKDQMMMNLPEDEPLTVKEFNDKPHSPEYEQLQELFGRDDTIKGDDEYVIQK
ncbi:unnamed protein product [Diamesa hyperborea]